MSLARMAVTAIPILASMAVLAVYKYQTKLVYPSSMPVGSRDVVDKPSDYGMPYEEAVIETEDGEKLRAYVILQDEKRKFVSKTILMLGPNAGNMGHYLPCAGIFYKEMGYNVVMLSYRGYGFSTGSPTESGLKKDAQAMMGYLETHPVVSQTALVLYGRSLGGGVAFYLASLGNELIKGVIVENTFLSIIKVLPNVFPILKPLSFLCSEKWDTESLVHKVPTNVPVLFLSGAKDELVPPSHMKELYDMCKSDEKKFELFADGTHNDTIVQKNYWAKVAQFLAQYIAPYENEKLQDFY